MRFYSILLLLLLSSIFVTSNAQYTQVGNGAFQNAVNLYGPMSTLTTSPFYNRHAYIYPNGCLGVLSHGDTIRSIEFKRGNNDSLVGTVHLKIYIKNSKKAHFGAGSINWAKEARDSGLVLVYDDNPINSIGSTPEFVRFDFTEVDHYVFDTTGGAIHLEILVEYTQTTNQPANSLWYAESSATVNFQSSNETKYVRGNNTNWLDSITTGSTVIKPTLRLNHPVHKKQLEINTVYALGTIPILMNRPDTVKCSVRNVGLETVYNHKVYMEITGANSFLDSAIIDSIRPFEHKFIYFAAYLPSSTGTEQINIRLDEDDYLADNEYTRVRIVNYNEYSHMDPAQGSAGGIGFNGSTGDFVAKFYVKGSAWINQIKVDFSSSGRPFQLVVWEDDGPGGAPGTIKFVSDTQLTAGGTFIMPVLPRIKVIDGYYVGIRQTGNTNVAFSFQFEIPVRPHSFYFAAPAGDSVWIPFSPGFDYNFNIRPRLQVANDLAVTEFINPINGDSLRYSTTDSVIPMVRVHNFGFVDQNNFEVYLEIRTKTNLLELMDTVLLSLPAGKDSVISFKSMSLYNFGSFVAKSWVNLNIDSVKDNNQASIEFSISKKHDVAADLIFEPLAGDSFEVKTEGFWPQVRVINFGTSSQLNFPVTIRIVKDGQVLASQTKLESLGGFGSSKIMAFDTMYVPLGGWCTFEAFTSLSSDSFPENDTSRRQIYGSVNRDIGILEIIKPLVGIKQSTDVNIQPYISYRNHGLQSQTNFEVSARIYNAAGTLVYSDTLIRSLPFFSFAQALFKKYNTGNTPGWYRLQVEVNLTDDQIAENDTMSLWFEVVDGRDLVLMEVLKPVSDSVYILDQNGSLNPTFKVRNNGLVDAGSVTFHVHVYNETGAFYYADTLFNISVSVSDTLLLSSKAMSLARRGNYELFVINAWADEDKHSQNDSLRMAFSIVPQKDLQIVSHLHPEPGQEVTKGTGLVPRIRIRNIGFDTLFNVNIELTIRDEASNIHYRDTISYAQLEYLGTTDIAGKQTTISDTGNYTLNSRYLDGDHWINNDTLTTGFIVFTDYDISLDSSPFQNLPEFLDVGKVYKPSVWVSNAGREDFIQPNEAEVFCQVFADGNMIYFRSSQVQLLSGESKLVEFDSSLNHDEVSDLIILFFVSELNDRDRSNDTLEIATQFVDKSGVSELLQAIEVYPNPFGNTIRINAGVPITNIALYDGMGRKVFEMNADQALSFDLVPGVDSGVYYLYIQTDLGTGIFKLVKI